VKVGQLIAERYELEELAGTGGMSNVYRAYDQLLERRVAIKVLHERYSHDTEYVERFRREAKAIARLSHPNILTVIDRGEWEHHQFIVFEYVDGDTLKDLVAREGPLPVRDALVLVCEIGRGLAFAHEHGVVHRDVKPHNVIIDREGTPKVTDFGIARSLDRENGLTTTGTLLGTSDYLAPEQAAGRRVSERSDQYSLGVLLYELLTGEVPYPAESPVGAAMRHLNDPIPSVRDARPDVPPEVDELVGRAMQKEPEDRFASTAAFLTALDACLAPYDEDTLSDLWADGGSTAIVSPPVREEPVVRGRDAPPARRKRRRPLWPLLIALVVVAGAAIAAVLVFRDGGGLSIGPGEQPSDGAASIRLRAAGDHDPEGDGVEHPEAVDAATDGDPLTYWTTETYGSFDKPGVGIVLRASAPVGGGTLVVRAGDDSGYTAEIRASNRRDGGFETISEGQAVSRRTTFELDTGGEEYRFLLVWITELGPNGRAHVNEVALRS
jgi:tRNA A-37 threonylcarbamoyl transferase component Bud32